MQYDIFKLSGQLELYHKSDFFVESHSGLVPESPNYLKVRGFLYSQESHQKMTFDTAPTDSVMIII